MTTSASPCGDIHIIGGHMIAGEDGGNAGSANKKFSGKLADEIQDDGSDRNI